MCRACGLISIMAEDKFGDIYCEDCGYCLSDDCYFYVKGEQTLIDFSKEQ
jgi:transcription initiation factor TFIIIB Brf1 subunit/transcription initiation factor TFIIB